MGECTDTPTSCHVEKNIFKGKNSKSKVIYGKIKAEVDTLGTPKTAKQVRE